jgi:hypothetical protein
MLTNERNVPIGAVAFLLVLVVLKLQDEKTDVRKALTIPQKINQLDPIGAIAVIAAVCLPVSRVTMGWRLRSMELSNYHWSFRRSRAPSGNIRHNTISYGRQCDHTAEDTEAALNSVRLDVSLFHGNVRVRLWLLPAHLLSVDQGIHPDEKRVTVHDYITASNRCNRSDRRHGNQVGLLRMITIPLKIPESANQSARFLISFWAMLSTS